MKCARFDSVLPGAFVDVLSRFLVGLHDFGFARRGLGS